MKAVRTVFHAHSRWSYDAQWPLDRLAHLFGRLGVRAVMMSEHDTGFAADHFDDYVADCAAASTPACLLVPGIEYSSPENDVHILTWGVDRFLGEHRPVMDTLKDVAAAGGVSILAHPARREAWRRFMPEWKTHLAGIEIWNRKTDGIAPGRQATDLVCRTGLMPTCGMDFHRSRQIWPLTNRVMVEEGLPLGDALVQAIALKRVTPQFLGLAFGNDENARNVRLLGACREAERARKSILRLWAR